MATVSIANTTANISGKTVTLAERDHTITGSWTFSRSPSAPFVVTAGSAKVTNLDADKLDGLDSTAFMLASGGSFLPITGGTLTGDLLFTDATYDIGKSGATRPRDIFASRNVAIGGTLNVAGVTTFSASAYTIHAGGIDISGAGSGQIVFPATQVAAGGANTLDDYEEGTWTPVLGGSGGTSGQAYTTQVGRYTKIGKRVQVEGYIVLSTKGTITGNCQIQGLPFTQENTANLFATGSFSYWATLATNWVFLSLQGITNTTTAGLWGLTAAGATLIQPTTADINNTSQLVFNFSYMATA